MTDYGKLLDQTDIERKQSVKNSDDLYHASSHRLRKLFFNDVIDRMHSDGTMLLTGSAVKNANDIAPFLYFMNSVSLEISPDSPQAKKPLMLKPYLEKKLISIFLTDKFSSFSEQFQKLAYEYPEYFVGPSSYFAYKFFKLNDSLPHKPIEEGGTCLHCEISNKLHQAVHQIKMDKELREFTSRIGNLIMTIPTKAADFASNVFVDTLRKPNENSLRELDNTVNLMYYLSSSYAFDSIPQINAEFVKSPNLFVEPLRINHNEQIDLNQYLEVIKDFRGVLSPKILQDNKSNTLSQVISINEEVDKIESSKRLPLGSFLYKFSTSLPSVISRILTQGTYGAEGLQLQPLKKFETRYLKEVKSEILSKYFGVSKTGVQIWQIRRRLNP